MNKWILPALLCLCLTACTARPDSSAPKARPEAPPEPAEIEYLNPIRKEPADADTAEAAVPSTDADWKELAAMVLSQVGTDVFGQTPASVTHETDDLWQRPEVTVAFADGMTVTFREDTAALIHISAFPSSQDSGTPMDEEDVLSAALSYYNALPHIRGYEYHHVENTMTEAGLSASPGPFSSPSGTRLTPSTTALRRCGLWSIPAPATSSFPTALTVPWPRNRANR